MENFSRGKKNGFIRPNTPQATAYSSCSVVGAQLSHPASVHPREDKCSLGASIVTPPFLSFSSTPPVAQYRVAQQSDLRKTLLQTLQGPKCNVRNPLCKGSGVLPQIHPWEGSSSWNSTDLAYCPHFIIVNREGWRCRRAGDERTSGSNQPPRRRPTPASDCNACDETAVGRQQQQRRLSSGACHYGHDHLPNKNTKRQTDAQPIFIAQRNTRAGGFRRRAAIRRRRPVTEPVCKMEMIWAKLCRKAASWAKHA